MRRARAPIACLALTLLAACTTPHSERDYDAVHESNFTGSAADPNSGVARAVSSNEAEAARAATAAVGNDAGAAQLAGDSSSTAARGSAHLAATPWKQRIAGTTLEIELVPIPAGSIDVDDASAANGKRHIDVAALSFSKTEIPWELYDTFVFALDKPNASTPDEADAITRPSHPYITMDRGFGHAGYPAISVSMHGAQEFCRWLSIKTGRSFRLPTEAEWEYACRAGEATTEDAQALDARAWFRDNAHAKTHPCGEKLPNAWGLCDMLGNAAEWCTSIDGKGAVRGGSFRDGADDVTCRASKPNNPAWNKSDPQLPRGIWWLADAPFVGFRVVCEASSASATQAR